MERGFLYIANRPKFIEEALISVRSLKRFNQEPVCLVCPEDLRTEEVRSSFDHIIIDPTLSEYTYLAKIIGMQQTPFERTIFLDSDTFITDSIAEVFDILDLVDFATTAEPTIHSFKREGLKYIDIFPEFNSGVIAYAKNSQMEKLLADWFQYCKERNIQIDMPGLREAVLMNFKDVRFSILPNCYNEHGFYSMLLLHQKVKVIHERIGYKKGVLTPHFADFETMDKFAKKINKVEHKRLYIPKIGLISYRWSPMNFIQYVKKKLGYKRVSKNK